MTLWITVMGMGVITYLIRIVLILLLERVQLRQHWQKALHYVPTAVLTAIIIPEILFPGGTLDISLDNLRLLTGIAAALVAWRTHNVLWTIITGMSLLWLLQAIF